MSSQVDQALEVAKILSTYDVAIIAGLVSLITSLVTSFLGPLLLEKRKAKIEEDTLWGPVKNILKNLLDNAASNKGRSIKTLKRVIGLPEEQICRLLISIGARGFTREDGEEAWCYVSERPFKEQ
ncbi:hypothetical protein [Pseudoalteromonas sp. TAE56]|jgi:hypothetical protein|uniref:hypothetical protein n=1 Tax=Pseudoalteromonas sp. TAE56 TaxID=1938596 RepID=UPI0004635075|nr:hypothetical protein [Pseudoalteromonas sp. TAE56]